MSFPQYKIYFLSVLFFALIFTIQAAPFKGEKFNFRQPDGSEVPVNVWGDEYYQRVESIDGYTLTRNNKGWICYARLNETKTELISTGIIYTGQKFETATNFNRNRVSSIDLPTGKGLDLEKRAIEKIRKSNYQKLHQYNTPPENHAASSRISATENHSIKGLTLLIEFSDEPASISGETIDKFFNEKGFSDYGNNGSVKDYFHDVSGGYIEYSNEVIGYYKARKPKSYYDDNTTFGHVHELLNEALIWLDDQGFDFSTLTTENGTVKAVNLMYAGEPSYGWSKGLWPHMSYHNFEADGVSTGAYQMTYIGNTLSIGTTCHENGHMLFHWPDLYDYDYNSAGAGNYCLMSYFGNPLNPLPPNAYLRTLAGWDKTTILNGKKGTFSITSDTTESFQYKNPRNSQELYVMESRTRTGRSKNLSGEGLLIWHIDEYGINSFEQRTFEKHYKVSLEQADGLYELENNVNQGNSGDLFKASSAESFNDFTLPDARWWNNTKSGFAVSNISASGKTMTFTAGEQPQQLDPPTEVFANAGTASDALLFWKDNNSVETGFVIERSTMQGNFSVIASVQANTISYCDKSLNRDSLYIYRVYSISGHTRSDYSESAYVSIRQNQKISLGKPSSASSSENSTLTAQFATDGNMKTRWSSQFSEPQWITIDLQRTFLISQINIFWEKASAADFSLESSADGNTWITFKSVSAKSDSVNKFQNLHVVARFVRLQAQSRTTPWGFSIYEFEIFGELYSKPTVLLTTPAPKESEANAPVELNVLANDAEGFITRVDYFVNDTLTGSSHTSPFSYTWEPKVAGAYTLGAVAYDNQGLSSTSQSEKFQIYNLPETSLEISENINELFAPATITFNADATDEDGFITRVEYFQKSESGDFKLGESLTYPYTFTKKNLPAGEYTFWSKAYDNQKHSSVSEEVSISVAENLRPLVTLSASEYEVIAPASLYLSAIATDADGQIKRISLFLNDELIDSVTSDFRTFDYTFKEAGEFIFKATATDDRGAVSLESAIKITVIDTSRKCFKQSVSEVAGWKLRNGWSDQQYGSEISASDTALKITHRTWGKNDLYLTQSKASVHLEKDKTYSISFELSGFENFPAKSITVGFAEKQEWYGPDFILSGTAEIETKKQNFSAYSLSLTPKTETQAMLAFRFEWAGQPSQPLNGFLKNLTICETRRMEQLEELPIEISPNPAAEWIIMNTNSTNTTAQITEIQIVDMMGKMVARNLPEQGETESTVRMLVKDLPAGIYTVVMKTEEGIRKGKFLKAE